MTRRVGNATTQHWLEKVVRWILYSTVHFLGRYNRRGNIRDDSAEILFQSFLQEAIVGSSGMGKDVYFDVVHPAFPLLTTASPTLQGVLKDGFGEAVVACDMPEPCKFPSLDKVP